STGITVIGDGTPGIGATELYYPRGIAFDSAMNMHDYCVSDHNQQSISGNSGWNKTGITVLSSSSSPIATSGVFIDPNDNLYAVDENNNYVVWRLLKNAVNATVVAGTFGSPGSSSTQLYYANDVYVDKSGTLYVTDAYNYRIQKFSSGSNRGITIGGTGSGGSALNQLNTPRYFTFDSTETYMYVADTGNNRIVRLSTNSTSGTNEVLEAGGTGANNVNTSLNGPWGIHYLPSISNDLFITNYGGHSVIRWTPGASSGSFIAGTPGVSGSDSTHLNSPMGIKIDSYMNITGITVIGDGTPGIGATELYYPRGIAFDSAMNMYVGDTGNHRVQKFMKL
ncbi:unnamed protein product, partial [Adineta steineri]